MEYNSRVSIILPDSIGQMENDFEDHEDIVREQTNRNEVKIKRNFYFEQYFRFYID
jgi:hypothetical protein